MFAPVVPRLSRFTARWLLEGVHEQLVGTTVPVLPVLSDVEKRAVADAAWARAHESSRSGSALPPSIGDVTPEQRGREAEAWRLLAAEAHTIMSERVKDAPAYRPQRSPAPAPAVAAAGVDVSPRRFGSVFAATAAALVLGWAVGASAPVWVAFAAGVVLGGAVVRFRFGG